MIGQGDGNRLVWNWRQHAEVKHDDDGDEEPQDQQEFALGDQIGFAGLVNQFGNLEHGAMHWHIPQAGIDDQPEAQTEDAEQNADHQQAMTVNAEEQYLREVGKFQAGFAADFMGRLGQGGNGTETEDGDGGCHRPGEDLGELASFGHSSRQPGAHRNSSGMKTISGPSRV